MKRKDFNAIAHYCFVMSAVLDSKNDMAVWYPPLTKPQHSMMLDFVRQSSEDGVTASEMFEAAAFSAIQCANEAKP